MPRHHNHKGQRAPAVLRVHISTRAQRQDPKALEANSNSLSSRFVKPVITRTVPEIDLSCIAEEIHGFDFSTFGIVSTPKCTLAEFAASLNKDKTPSTPEPQPEPLPQKVAIDALEEKVAMLVNFMLLKYKMKELITKDDILNTIERDENNFEEILQRASERMELVFGVDVREVDSTSQRYALLIKMGLTYDGMRSGEEGVPKAGILILILGVIFLKGNRATEEEVWEVLNLTGIFSGVRHFVFGEPKQLIMEDFVRENYLIYQQVASSNPPQFEFVWGPRAFVETTKWQVLEFVAKIHGAEPRSFPIQYEEAIHDVKGDYGNISARPESPTLAAAKCSGSSHT